MPRGDHKIEGIPYRTWIAEVDPYNRVRLSLSELRAVVPWLNSESDPIDCVAAPGPAGGIQIEPASVYEALKRQFTEALGDAPARSSESAEKWVDVARLLATAWRIPISIESGRVSITLPEPTRRALQLPGAGATVVVFGFAEILEVWDAAKWHDYVRVVAKTKVSAVSVAVEDLRNRY